MSGGRFFLHHTEFKTLLTVTSLSFLIATGYQHRSTKAKEVFAQTVKLVCRGRTRTVCMTSVLGGENQGEPGEQLLTISSN